MRPSLSHILAWLVAYVSVPRLEVVAVQLEQPSKAIHGVPIYGDVRSVVQDAKHNRPEWIVSLKRGISGVKVQSSCSRSAACVATSNSGRGSNYMILKATESELQSFVKESVEELEFIELDAPIEIPPTDLSDRDANTEQNLSGPSANRGDDDMHVQYTKKGPVPCPLPRCKGVEYCVFGFDCGAKAVHGSKYWDFYGKIKDCCNLFDQRCCLPGMVLVPVRETRPESETGRIPITDWSTALKHRKELSLGGTYNQTSWKDHASAYQRLWSQGGCNWCVRFGLGGCAVFPPPSCQTTTTTTPVCESAVTPIPLTDRWGLDRIDGQWLFEKESKDGRYGNRVSNGQLLDGRGVHVYVVDTGIRASHTDFEGRVIPTIETGSGTVKVCKPSDMSCAQDTNQGKYKGHGTHVAGTIAGKYSGVAKGATLHAAKVFQDDSALTSLSKILLAVDWITDFGERPAVISMSLGSRGRSPSLKSSIDRATNSGISVVVASGNDGGLGTSSCDYSPAFVKSAITVGAVYSFSNVRGVSGGMLSKAGYSNQGKCTDIHAPGSDVLSAGSQSDDEFLKMSGTSMSAPHVSGAAALLLQMDKSMKPADVKKYLQYFATKGVIFGINNETLNFFLRVTCYSTATTTTTTATVPPPPPPRTARRRSPKRRRSAKRRRRKNGQSRRRSSGRRRSQRRRKR